MTTLNSIKPATHDIVYYRNDVLDLAITVTDQDGVAVDLSGKTLTFQARKKKTSTSTVINISTPSKITVSGASNNVVTFSGTYDLAERSYYYDLENTTDSETIMCGMFIVTGDVTRP